MQTSIINGKTQDRELVQINLSSLPDATDLKNKLEPILETIVASGVPMSSAISLNMGGILLTPSELVKLRSQVLRYGYLLDSIYTSDAVTQNAAIDEQLEVLNPETFIQTDKTYGVLQQPEEVIQPTTTKTGVTQPAAVTFIEAEAFGNEAGGLEMFASEVESPTIGKTSLKEAILTEKDEQGQDQLVETTEELLCETMLYRSNLRSGQVLQAPGHVVLIGDAHAGSEIVAGGDIYVWGQLNGIAHAGVNGRKTAKIAAFKIEALQLRIADMIARRPDRLFKAENVMNSAPQRHQVEVARIVKNEIQIFEESLR